MNKWFFIATFLFCFSAHSQGTIELKFDPFNGLSIMVDDQRFDEDFCYNCTGNDLLIKEKINNLQSYRYSKKIITSHNELAKVLKQPFVSFYYNVPWNIVSGLNNKALKRQLEAFCPNGHTFGYILFELDSYNELGHANTLICKSKIDNSPSIFSLQ